MTRDELIAALEKATGPDHDLDRHLGNYLASQGISTRAATDFTGSRDAMIPGAEGLDWYIVRGGWPSEYGTHDDDGLWHADCRYRRPPPENAPPTTGYYRQYWGSAATEPLARRIAEIKALVKP